MTSNAPNEHRTTLAALALIVFVAVGCGGGSAVPSKDGGAGSGGQAAGSAGTSGSAGSGTAGSSSSGAAGADAGMTDGATTGSAGATSSGAAGAAGQGTAGQGAAGQGTGGSAAPTLAATWTYPAMIAMGNSTLAFPTYVSHLLGKTITEPFPTDLACATVANSGASAATAHLSVSLGTYGAAVTADVSNRKAHV